MVIVKKRVLKQPRSADKAQQLKYALRRARRQHHKWPSPEDAELVLSLHFTVKSFSRQSYHADATLEIPTKDGFEYYSITGGSNTSSGALRQVISKIQNSKWFHHMKSRKVYFQITGAGMEELYRGYL